VASLTKGDCEGVDFFLYLHGQTSLPLPLEQEFRKNHTWSPERHNCFEYFIIIVLSLFKLEVTTILTSSGLFFRGES
jgi:hypothetical protein